jgi:hypothetical protein
MKIELTLFKMKRRVLLLAQKISKEELETAARIRSSRKGKRERERERESERHAGHGGDGTKEWRKAQASTCRNYYPLFLFFQIDAKEGSTDPSRTCSGPTRFISSLLTLLSQISPHCKLVFSFVRAALVHAISQDREAYDK